MVFKIISIISPPRFFLYVIILDPWYILPVNLLHGFTYGIMYSSLTAYMSSLTPPSLHGTTQGLINTLTWNLGISTFCTVMVPTFQNSLTLPVFQYVFNVLVF